MVKLEELEDEHFVNKPETTSDGALLADDDEDYTDTGQFTIPILAIYLFFSIYPFQKLTWRPKHRFRNLL